MAAGAAGTARATFRSPQRSGLATLLLDLLTADEEQVDLRVDVGLLAGRLGGALDWCRQQPGPAFRVGLSGASTGGAAALLTAARHPALVAAAVCRGGRPDPAPDVRAPVLQHVGERAPDVLARHRRATERLGGPTNGPSYRAQRTCSPPLRSR